MVLLCNNLMVPNIAVCLLRRKGCDLKVRLRLFFQSFAFLKVVIVVTTYEIIRDLLSQVNYAINDCPLQVPFLNGSVMLLAA